VGYGRLKRCSMTSDAGLGVIEGTADGRGLGSQSTKSWSKALKSGQSVVFYATRGRNSRFDVVIPTVFATRSRMLGGGGAKTLASGIVASRLGSRESQLLFGFAVRPGNSA
jgi:hypothetical protein